MLEGTAGVHEAAVSLRGGVTCQEGSCARVVGSANVPWLLLRRQQVQMRWTDVDVSEDEAGAGAARRSLERAGRAGAGGESDL